MESLVIGLLLAVLAGGALVVSRISPRFAGSVSWIGSALGFLLATLLTLRADRGVYGLGHWVSGLGLELSFRLDALTLALALLVVGVGTFVLHYAANYFGPSLAGRRAAAWLLAFEFSMLGLVLSDNVLLLFVFWELTSLCSFFLVQMEAAKSREAEPAARQALLVTVLGGLFLLVGLLLIQSELGSASLSEWASGSLEPRAANVALVLVAIGALTKSAQVPFHFWLPGAMAAPSPISAYLHSATMVKAGIILLVFLFPVLGVATLWTPLLLAAGVATCIWGSYRALAETDVKKLMAWSTVSQLGLLVLTLGLGTQLALRAALLHLFAHGVFKAALFLAVGSIDKATGTRDLRELGGLARREPVLAAAVLVSAGSMAGLPPLAGFLSKELILKKTMLADPALHLPALVAIIVASIGTVAYSARFVHGVFFGAGDGKSKRDSGPASRTAEVSPNEADLARGVEADIVEKRRLPPGLIVAPAALSALSILAGAGATWTDQYFLEPVTAALLGHELEPPKLKLWYGWNVPLFLSLGIVVGGLLLAKLATGQYAPVRVTRLAPHRLYDQAFEAAAVCGNWLDRILTKGDPRIYVVSMLAIGFSTAVPYLLRMPVHSVGSVDVPALLISGGLLLAGVGLLRAGGNVAKILWSSVLGFGVAGLFRRTHAPDLVLTQLLVELIVTVVLLVAVRRLEPLVRGQREGGHRAARPRVWLGLRHFAALVVALGAASLVVAFEAVDPVRSLRDVYATAGPTLAEGKNLVNVILVDFRGLDTFVETWVVMLAGVGVVALLRGAETAPISLPRGTLRPSGAIFRWTSQFLIPLGVMLALVLVLRGHNDPGGGFAASLVLLLTWLLHALACGDRGLADHHFHARRATFSGLGVLLASAALPMLSGEVALRQAGTKLAAGTPFAWKAHSALFFDIGVVLTVAGAGVSALLALFAWRRS